MKQSESHPTTETRQKVIAGRKVMKFVPANDNYLPDEIEHLRWLTALLADQF